MLLTSKLISHWLVQLLLTVLFFKWDISWVPKGSSLVSELGNKTKLNKIVGNGSAFYLERLGELVRIKNVILNIKLVNFIPTEPCTKQCTGFYDTISSWPKKQLLWLDQQSSSL